MGSNEQTCCATRTTIGIYPVCSYIKVYYLYKKICNIHYSETSSLSLHDTTICHGAIQRCCPFWKSVEKQPRHGVNIRDIELLASYDEMVPVFLAIWTARILFQLTCSSSYMTRHPVVSPERYCTVNKVDALQFF